MMVCRDMTRFLVAKQCLLIKSTAASRNSTAYECNLGYSQAAGVVFGHGVGRLVSFVERERQGT